MVMLEAWKTLAVHALHHARMSYVGGAVRVASREAHAAGMKIVQ